MFNQYRNSTSEQVNPADREKFLKLITIALDPINRGSERADGKYYFRYDHLGYGGSSPIFPYEDAKALAAFLTEKGIPCKLIESRVGMQEYEYLLEFSTNKNTLIEALNKLFPTDTAASAKPENK